jgi:hypothetical protein
MQTNPVVNQKRVATLQKIYLEGPGFAQKFQYLAENIRGRTRGRMKINAIPP